MPAKNSVKQFIENGYYHLYNRGVEKRNIFIDEQDYLVFINYLKKYLDPTLGSDPKSLANEVDLIAFCLMPNHFHLLTKQNTQTGITKLMRAVCTTYVMYFNRKYNRVGTLFQGKYKAAIIMDDIYLLHLSRYIHLNPYYPGSDPKTYNYSSYNYYLGSRNAPWLKSAEILDFFKTAQKTSLKDCLSYQSFVEDYNESPGDILEALTLE
ncbi:transposase [Candidatus Daviesbacteria bacterium]|nr:transposase [Candidatus Daviesbacteria bacterium]